MKHTKAILAASIMLGLGTAHANAQNAPDVNDTVGDRDRSANTEQDNIPNTDQRSTNDRTRIDRDGSANTEQANMPNTDQRSTNDRARIDRDLEPIDVDDFVEEASAKGIAEIEAAEAALENGTAQIEEFARQMITDHEAANNELAALARAENLEISENAGLIDRAKTMMLQVRDGESFDEAYINNQITAHEDSIELFERASISDNQAISNYATETLPTLREHLEKARSLENSITNNRE